MRGVLPVIRHAKLLAAVGLFLAAPGIAGGVALSPSTAKGPAETSCGIWQLVFYSSSPVQIALVGSSSGTPDAMIGQFTVVARVWPEQPVPGASIVIDLSNVEDLTLCPDQLDPDAVANSSWKTVRKFTDQNGTATFTVLGSSNGAGNGQTLLAGGRIYVNGVLLSSPTVATYDLDGATGVGANDLSAWLTDFGSGNAFGRSDYDGTGALGANDLSFWLSAYGAAGSTSSCAASSP